MKTHLTELLTQAAKVVVPDQDHLNISIERPKIAEHGDFSSNLALLLARSLKQPPRAIAQTLINALPTSHYVAKIEIAGAGFINFFMSSAAKSDVVKQIFADQNYGRSQSGQNRKVQVEFVSANPTGPLHVGHGRGAAIGDCLCRLLEATGWDVTREFYYNDTGQQINNLVLSVQLRCKNITPDDPAWLENGYCGDYIKDIADAYMAKKQIIMNKQKIKAIGDPEDLEAIRQFSVAYLRCEQDIDLYAFKVSFDVFSLESKLYDDGKVEQTVQQLISSGYTYEQDAALWLRTTRFGDDKDRVMRKREGTYTYFVPDVAYHKDKWQRGFTRVINEQGADHHSTITRVRAGLQALNVGIPDNWPEYVLHQMVTVMRNGEEVKISKRAGSYVTLRDLIDEVGCDATRYFLVARRADSQLVFDIDLARAQTNDNPVYYIQYAHARICSVLHQWGGNSSTLSHAKLEKLTSKHELDLLQRLSEYPEVIETAARELAPYMVAYYLKVLASEFHSYYNAHQFLIDQEETKHARLALAAATRQIIFNGLDLLGISAPEKM